MEARGKGLDLFRFKDIPQKKSTSGLSLDVPGHSHGLLLGQGPDNMGSVACRTLFDAPRVSMGNIAAKNNEARGQLLRIENLVTRRRFGGFGDGQCNLREGGVVGWIVGSFGGTNGGAAHSKFEWGSHVRIRTSVRFMILLVGTENGPALRWQSGLEETIVRNKARGTREIEGMP